MYELLALMTSSEIWVHCGFYFSRTIKKMFNLLLLNQLNVDSSLKREIYCAVSYKKR